MAESSSMLAPLREQLEFVRERVALLRGQARRTFQGASFLGRQRLYLDFAFSFLLHGSSPADYFEYDFAAKRHRERRTFVTFVRGRKIVRCFNDPDSAIVFKWKPEFLRTFGDLIGREFFDPDRGDLDGLGAFLAAHSRIVLKPRDEEFGKGIHWLSEENRRDVAGLFATMRSRGLIAEEAISQHPDLAALHPASVNTLRVVSVLARGRAQLVCAALRIGNNGQVVDNFQFGGIGAAVDLATGRVSSTGVDRHGVRYTNHPLTGVPIRGFQVPAWPVVVELVETAARRMPKVRFVGWDVAVMQDGRPVLVEGNDSPGFHVQQIPDGIGKWPVYRALMTGR